MSLSDAHTIADVSRSRCVIVTLEIPDIRLKSIVQLPREEGLDIYDYISIIIVIMRTQYLQELPEHWLNTAEVLRALGDATRQRILLLFEPGEELNIKTIADLFLYSRTSVTHHITVLERAGILARTKSGRDVFLRLNKNVLADALESVLTYIKTEV